MQQQLCRLGVILVPASAKIIGLRDLLASKFPKSATRAGGILPTGLPCVDSTLGGGIGLGGMTEIVCPVGGGLILSALLESTLQRKGLMAIIDGGNAFDLAGIPTAALNRLLWVRTRSATDAVKAADLLLRDGNLSLVVMDLRRNSARDTSSVPATSWYRLQRVVEPTSTAFLILARTPLVSAARPRLRVAAQFSSDAFDRRQCDLVASLGVAMIRGNEEPIRQFA